ncbi:MAG: ABC transporter ATP-binding protein [Oscillospiraceae bacterium]
MSRKDNDSKMGRKHLFKALSGHIGEAAITLLFATIASLSAVFATLVIGWAIDCATGPGNVDYVALLRNLILLGVLYLLSAVFTWLVAIFANRIAFGVSRDLRGQVFEKLGRLPLSFFDQNPHGDIISRFTNDLDSVSDALSLGLVSLFTGIVTVLSALALMLSLSWRITLVILLVTPLCFAAAWLVAHLSQTTFRKQQDVVGEMSAYVSEMVGNQKIVKAFGYEEESAKRFGIINQVLKKTGTNAQFASAMINPSTRFVDNLSSMLLGIVGGFTAIAGGVSVGVVSSFLIFSGQFSKPFNEFSGIMTNIQTALASLERIHGILSLPEETPDSPDAAELESPKGEVAFKDVDFSYSKDRELIKGLTLQAKPGNLIAIVGPTGAGKTTIVNLLMRFYEIDAGAITVDGGNITAVTRDSLRRSFGMVLQETWLFRGTIRENIAYGRPDATQEEIESAARFSHAHSFIKRMAKGYDTMLDEDGGNLSQGQKQLLTIARVMLTNPSMLILDEATSSIDTLTEIRVQRAFLKMMQGRTSFVIAHRLSTIVSADLILVLDKGKIVETGTHRQLLDKNGFYAELYRSQFE